MDDAHLTPDGDASAIGWTLYKCDCCYKETCDSFPDFWKMCLLHLNTFWMRWVSLQKLIEIFKTHNEILSTFDHYESTFTSLIFFLQNYWYVCLKTTATKKGSFLSFIKHNYITLSKTISFSIILMSEKNVAMLY